MMINACYDLSRDFQLERIEPITLVSIKHRISLVAVQKDDNDSICSRCSRSIYSPELHPCPQYYILIASVNYTLAMCIYDKSSNKVLFIVKYIRLICGELIPITSKYQKFNITKIQWWKYEDELSISICNYFALKVMLIRDLASFDVWCYVVGLIIESDKTREIVFV